MAPSEIRGKLLVANPELPDLNFDRTVVLMLAHGDDGSLGVVLNRPSQTGLGEALPSWEAVASAPGVVFMGGPVSQETVIGVAGAPSGVFAGDTAGGGDWVSITGELGTIDLQQDPLGLPVRLGGLRVFVGYAGWGPGQLESEILAGGWWLVDGGPDDAFSADPAQLWKRVLRRQPGRLALVSSYPADPDFN